MNQDLDALFKRLDSRNLSFTYNIQNQLTQVVDNQNTITVNLDRSDWNDPTTPNADYSASTVSGTGALSLYSTTYDFTRNIAQIDTGNVKYALYRNTTFDSCIEFDDTTFNINDIDLSGNATTVIGKDTKGYIATAGGNKFFIVADASTVYSYPLDANNNIVSGTVNTYACTVVTGSRTLRQVHVAAAIGDDIWVAQME